MLNTSIKGALILMLLLVFNCKESKVEITQVQLLKEGEIVLNDNQDRVANIMEGLQVTENGHAYGIDFITKLPFILSLKSGDVKFLSSKGRGPKELLQPVQLILKNDKELYVYDSALDKIAHFVNDEIVDKLPGYSRDNIWLRNSYGFYFNNHLITAFIDPTMINTDKLNYEEARSLAFYNLADSTTNKRGRLSPTLDKLDSYGKYPLMAMDDKEEVIYYVFSMDHTVMKYDIKRDSSWVVGTYKPEKIRTRSLKVDYRKAPTLQSAKKYGLDITRLVGIEIIDDELLIVWQNAQPEFYDQRNSSNKLRDYFGILYDLDDFNQVAELSLPGKFLGTYENTIMIEENENLDTYTIGFYKIANIDTTKIDLEIN